MNALATRLVDHRGPRLPLFPQHHIDHRPSANATPYAHCCPWPSRFSSSRCFLSKSSTCHTFQHLHGPWASYGPSYRPRRGLLRLAHQNLLAELHLGKSPGCEEPLGRQGLQNREALRKGQAGGGDAEEAELRLALKA